MPLPSAFWHAGRQPPFRLDKDASDPRRQVFLRRRCSQRRQPDEVPPRPAFRPRLRWYLLPRSPTALRCALDASLSTPQRDSRARFALPRELSDVETRSVCLSGGSGSALVGSRALIGETVCNGRDASLVRGWKAEVLLAAMGILILRLVIAATGPGFPLVSATCFLLRWRQSETLDCRRSRPAQCGE
jgi:hypothetical protein